VLYLLDIRQVDGNVNFSNELCNCRLQTVQKADYVVMPL